MTYRHNPICRNIEPEKPGRFLSGDRDGWAEIATLSGHCEVDCITGYYLWPKET